MFYFVTFRLADSLPKEVMQKLDDHRLAMLASYRKMMTPDVEQVVQRAFTRKLERLLDQNLGSCRLRDEGVSLMVANALGYFEGSLCRQVAWVIMPNHVHVLFQLLAGQVIGNLVGSWKSYTARLMNEVNGEVGAVWQKDYFDRAIRDEKHLANCVRYIRRNPAKAGLRDGEYRIWEGELAKGMGE